MGAKAETGANANRQQKRDHGAIVNRIKVAEKSQNFLTLLPNRGSGGRITLDLFQGDASKCVRM